MAAQVNPPLLHGFHCFDVFALLGRGFGVEMQLVLLLPSHLVQVHGFDVTLDPAPRCGILTGVEAGPKRFIGQRRGQLMHCIDRCLADDVGKRLPGGELQVQLIQVHQRNGGAAAQQAVQERLIDRDAVCRELPD